MQVEVEFWSLIIDFIYLSAVSSCVHGSSWSPSLLFAGKYGTEIRPAFWLNFIFLLFPAWGAITLFTKPKDRPLIGGYNVSPTCEKADVKHLRRNTFYWKINVMQLINDKRQMKSLIFISCRIWLWWQEPRCTHLKKYYLQSISSTTIFLKIFAHLIILLV